MINFSLIITLVIILSIIISGYILYKKITNKLRQVSRQLFGVDDFVEGFNRNADILAETPKSVSSMTRLMEPQIMRDFPEFSWTEFKHRAENMLTSALLAISSNNLDALENASEQVKKQVANTIEENRLNEIEENYSQIQIHQTEISNYKKQDGKVLDGDLNRKTQAKYNVELVYIQDAGLAQIDNAVGTTCPQCGAPIKNLGVKYCEYCGMGVTPINIHVWSLHKFYEVDYKRS